MSKDRDDTPTDPRYKELQAKVRKRSTRTTHLANLCAMEIAAIDGVTFGAGVEPIVAELVRTYLSRAADAASIGANAQLAKVGAEKEALRTRLFAVEMELANARADTARLELKVRSLER